MVALNVLNAEDLVRALRKQHDKLPSPETPGGGMTIYHTREEQYDKLRALSFEELELVRSVVNAIEAGKVDGIKAALAEVHQFIPETQLVLGDLYKPVKLAMQHAKLTVGKGYDLVRSDAGELHVLITSSTGRSMVSTQAKRRYQVFTVPA